MKTPKMGGSRVIKGLSTVAFSLMLAALGSASASAGGLVTPDPEAEWQKRARPPPKNPSLPAINLPSERATFTPESPQQLWRAYGNKPPTAMPPAEPRPQVVREKPRPQVVKEKPPPQVVKEKPPPQVVKEKPRPQVVKEKPRPQVVKEKPPPQVVKEKPPPQVVKEKPPPQVVKEKPPQVTKEKALPRRATPNKPSVQRESVAEQGRGRDEEIAEKEGTAQTQKSQRPKGKVLKAPKVDETLDELFGGHF